jgi:hypothetical protein
VHHCGLCADARASLPQAEDAAAAELRARRAAAAAARRVADAAAADADATADATADAAAAASPLRFVTGAAAGADRRLLALLDAERARADGADAAAVRFVRSRLHPRSFHALTPTHCRTHTGVRGGCSPRCVRARRVA